MVPNGHTPAGKQRWACFQGGPTSGPGRTFCSSTTSPHSPAVTQSGKPIETNKPLKFRRALGNATRFVITSAQNATPVNEEFLKSLEVYCEHNNAELIVIPIRYKNPTSRWTESQQNAEWWDERVHHYLYNYRKKLCANLVLLGDIKTIPTAESPLTGFDGITHGESGILGHSKLQLKAIPTPSHSMSKIMTTTGSVTLPNYTDSKAGKKGEFHHVFGATVVEAVGKKFHMRQINANKDGSFTDWTEHYAPHGVVPAGPALGLVMGDTHYRFIDPKVKEATFGPGGIADELNPRHLIWHDLLDGYSRNPHHNGNPFIELAKRYQGRNMHDVAAEVEETILFLQSMTAGRTSVVVPSNHDDFLRRWIIDTDWRQDPENARFYLETALAMVNSVKMGSGGSEYINPFTYWINQLAGKDDIICLDMDESFTLADIECGFHGHRGPNGARGTINNLSKLGVKVISGHGHSPGIENGHYRTGTSTHLRLEYTEGPSSWLNTHCIVYATGKRSLINIIDGEYKA